MLWAAPDSLSSFDLDIETTCIWKSAYIWWHSKGRVVGGLYPSVWTLEGALSVDHLETIMKLISLLFPLWKNLQCSYYWIKCLYITICETPAYWMKSQFLTVAYKESRASAPMHSCTHAHPADPVYSTVLPELTNLFVPSSLCYASVFTLNVYCPASPGEHTLTPKPLIKH